MPEKFIDDFTVVNNQKLNKDTFLLVLKHPGALPPIYAGQFAEVLVEGEPQTFLRRPLSIHDTDFENNTLSLFVKIVGKGTRKLSLLNLLLRKIKRCSWQEAAVVLRHYLI